MISCKWTIKWLKFYPAYEGLENVVFAAGYKCVGVEDDCSAQVEANTIIELNPDQPFTAYEDLTQEQVLNWIFAANVNKEEVEHNVAQQIANQKVVVLEVQEIPLPWAA